jgi:hypothetical protein
LRVVEDLFWHQVSGFFLGRIRLMLLSALSAVNVPEDASCVAARDHEGMMRKTCGG